MSSLETVSKSTWNVHGKVKQLYGMLHKAKTYNEREEIMRRVIQFPPEYETVFKNLIGDVNNTFMTDENCYSQFKNILLSFQQEVVDESGELIQFKIKFKSPSKSPGKPKSPSKSPGKPMPTCLLPTPLTHS